MLLGGLRNDVLYHNALYRKSTKVREFRDLCDGHVIGYWTDVADRD